MDIFWMSKMEKRFAYGRIFKNIFARETINLKNRQSILTEYQAGNQICIFLILKNTYLSRYYNNVNYDEHISHVWSLVLSPTVFSGSTVNCCGFALGLVRK